MLLVPGFGVWLGCILIYLRTMVCVHVFSRIPLVLPLQLVMALGPWIVAAQVQSFLVLGAVCGLLLLYTLSLSWQLCKIWRDLVDVFPNFLGCLLGLALTF